MRDDLKENIKKQSTWMRGLYMLLFSFLYGLADFVLFAIVIFQFILKVFTGDTNERLRKLAQSIATYIYQIIQFLSFNSDTHPYPFGVWTKGELQATKKTKASKPDTVDAPKKIEKD